MLQRRPADKLQKYFISVVNKYKSDRILVLRTAKQWRVVHTFHCEFAYQDMPMVTGLRSAS